MNENIQGPVQLAGRGFIYKPSGYYLPGEYAALDNVEISNDETIVNRRPLLFASKPNADSGFRKFIGSYKESAIIASTSTLHRMKNDTSVAGFTHSIEQIGPTQVNLLTLMPAQTGTVGDVFDYEAIQCEGFWTYNGYNYLLVLHIHATHYGVGNANQHVHYRLVLIKQATHTAVPDGGSDDPLVERIAFDGGVATTVVIDDWLQQDTYSATAPYTKLNDWPSHYVKNHFIYKERAWIVTEDTVFFSKATDPFVWAAPDGGFFKIPGQEIKEAIPLRDSIYILCDSSIYALSYDSDPNADAQMDLLSASVGSDTGVSVGDNIYFIKDDSLYVLVGAAIEKVMDLQLAEEPSPANTSSVSYSRKLAWFDDSLYLMYRKIERGATTSTLVYKGEDSKFTPNSKFFYRISLDNNSISRLEVDSEFKVLNNTAVCQPVDAFFVSAEGVTNQSHLYLAFKYTGPSDTFRVGYVGLNRSSKTAKFNDILPSHSDAVSHEISPNIQVLVVDFSPDNLRYYLKKYRSVLLTADVSQPVVGSDNPITSMQIYAGALQRNSADETILSVPVKTHQLLERTSYFISNIGYRFGLMQRAAVLSFNISRSALETAGTQIDSRFEISDLRVLWSYVGRGPVDNVNDKS